MVMESTESKAKLIIKTFLLAHKGKKFTSTQIEQFINGNKLGLGKYNITKYTITRWIKVADKNSLLGEVKMQKKTPGNVWVFWI